MCQAARNIPVCVEWSLGPQDQAGTCTYSQQNITSASTLLFSSAYHMQARFLIVERACSEQSELKEIDFSVNISAGRSI